MFVFYYNFGFVELIVWINSYCREINICVVGYGYGGCNRMFEEVFVECVENSYEIRCFSDE